MAKDNNLEFLAKRGVMLYTSEEVNMKNFE